MLEGPIYMWSFNICTGVVGAIPSHDWASREVGQSKGGAASAQTQSIGTLGKKKAEQV